MPAATFPLQITGEDVLERDLGLLTDLAVSRLPGLNSLLLGGSFARGEGTFILRGCRLVPYKDYDLFAVVDDHHARRAAATVALLRQEAYERLGYEPYDEHRPSPGQFHIGLAVIPRGALGRLPHDISNAELKLAGRILWGEDVRAEIRSAPSCIPPASGLRPVLNKLIGLVEQWGPWVEGHGAPKEEATLAVSYDAAKAVLDVAAALLLLDGIWTAGYGARNRVLREREREGPILPEIGPLADRAEEALAFKRSPRTPPREPSRCWIDARDQLLEVLEPLAAAVLSYPRDDSFRPPQRFARYARTALLAPYARDALARWGIPWGARASSPIVLGYSLLENVRHGRAGFLHPLIRAWCAAWAWLEVTADPTRGDVLLPWASSLVGSRTHDPCVVRQRIVALFKAASLARRIKRSL